jgi:hypothetical protein
MAVRDPYGDFYISNLTGGLETRLPANRLDPSMSPDLENVHLNDGAVSKRGGFVPFIKEHGNLNAIENKGVRRDVKVGTGETQSINIPGALFAGDREHFTQLKDGFTVEFFLRIDDLSGFAARGTAERGVTSYDEFNGLDDDVTLKVRPIISKGPVKNALPSAFGDALDVVTNLDTTDTHSFQTTTGGICQYSPTSRYGPDGLIMDCAVTGYSGVGPNTTLTFTSAQPHGLTTGDTVLVKGGGSTIDVADTVTVSSPTVFTITYTATVIASGPARLSVRARPEVLGHGMPFCVYLFNTNTRTSGTVDPSATDWEFRFSGHYRSGVTSSPTSGTFGLFTVTSTVTPRVGQLYHIIASVQYGGTGIARFRIGEFDDEARGFTYTPVDSGSLGNILAPINPPHPVQVFDCPQQFVENLSTAAPGIWDNSAFVSEPPGLGLHTNLTTTGYTGGFGGYFNCVKRFEGAIEDIAIWGTPLSGSSDVSRDRTTKLESSAQSDESLVNYWPMTSGSDRVIREGSGKDNHMYFTPDFPILDEESGGVESGDQGSWWFNGRTSYALADMDETPNWSLLPEWDDDAELTGETIHPREAFIQRVVKLGAGIGFHVEFVADSIELYEQVLAEIAGVIRCVIRPDGRLGLYFRDGEDFITAASTGDGQADRMFSHRYEGSIHSATKIVPGRRYAVTFTVNSNVAGTAYIAINGQIDTSSTRFSTPSAGGHPVGGLTIGMGSKYNPSETGRRGLTFANPNFGAATSDPTADTNDQTDTMFADPSALGSVIDIAEWAGISPGIPGYSFPNRHRVEKTDGGGWIQDKSPPFGGASGSFEQPFQATNYTDLDIDPVFNDGDGESPNRIGTDFRTAFCGRIEEVRLLVGDGVNQVQPIKDLEDEGYRFATQTLFTVPNPDALGTWGSDRQYGSEQRDQIEVSDPSVTPVDVRPGQGIRIDPIQGNGFPQLIANEANDITDGDSLSPSVPFPGAGGALELTRAGVRIYHVVGRWVLNKGSGEERIVNGRYRNTVEYRRAGVRQDYSYTTTVDTDKSVCEQLTEIEDRVGAFGALRARCIESDFMTEADQVDGTATDRVTGDAATRDGTYLAGRPFQEFTPRELSPKWATGLVRSTLNDTRVSLIADWDHTQSGERFVITATGRNLYWAKKLWRDDTPFGDDTASAWLFGQRGEYIGASSSNAALQAFSSDGATWGGQDIDLWVKPQRLDGRRVLVSRASLSNGRLNYLVGTQNGSLFVCGSLNSGAACWYYFEGDNRSDDAANTVNAITEDELGYSRLRLNQWNHVHVRIDPSQDNPVCAWINGSGVALTSLNGSTATNARGFVASTLTNVADLPDTAGQRLYIGGFPAGFQDVTLTTDEGASAGPSWTFTTQAYHGYLTEFRSRHGVTGGVYSNDDEDLGGGFSAIDGAPVPVSRFGAPDGTVGYQLTISDGEGWVFPNAAVAADAGQSQIKELIVIGSNLSDSREARYDWSVFRDNLYLTNGEGRPLEVRYRRYSHPDGPFFVAPMGMLPPTPATAISFDERVSKGETSIDLATSSSPSLQRQGINNRIPTEGEAAIPLIDEPPERITNASGEPAIYQFYVSFVDDLDRESDPALLGQVETGASGYQTQFSENTTGTGLNRFRLEGGDGQDYRFLMGSSVAIDGLLSGGYQDTPMLIYVDQPIGGSAQVSVGWYIARLIENGSTYYIYLPGTSTGNRATQSTNGNFQVWHGAFRLNGFPRSTDPQCVARRFYVSAAGGGRPILHSTLQDNVSESVELIGPPQTGIGMDDIGRKLTPPRAKFISSGSGFLVMANFTDAAAGRAAVAISDGQEITYWPLFNQFVLDSENGEEITGLGSHLERFYISKRNSIYRLRGGGTNLPVRVEPVNESVGVGGGFTKYDNLMFGVGERGVYRFDGSNVVYASSSLEGDWASVALKDTDLTNQFGAFHRDESQYWLSCRAPSAQTANPQANNRIYVLHTAVGDRQAWTRWEVPEHTYMSNVTDPRTQRPEVLIGCDDGRLLVYDRDVYVDGSLDEPGAAQLGASETQAKLDGLGTLTGGGLFTLTGGGLDVVRDGVRGMSASVYYLLDDGITVGTVLTRVVSNTATQLQLQASFPNNISLAYIALGAYQSYWTTGWMPARAGNYLQVHKIDLEYEPDDCVATLQWAAAVEPATSTVPVSKPVRGWFDTQNRQTANFSLTNGIQRTPQPVQQSNKGRYFRMFFGTPALPFSFEGSLVSSGIRNPWTLQGIGPRITDSGHMGSNPRS